MADATFKTALHYRALSLTEPWATLMAANLKHIETRSWAAPRWLQPGRQIALHAAKRFPVDAQELLDEEPFKSALYGAWQSGFLRTGFPCGHVIALMTFRGCKQVTGMSTYQHLSEMERAFGNYEIGRYMWEFSNVIPIAPQPYTGALGLWAWDPAETPLRNLTVRPVASPIAPAPAGLSIWDVIPHADGFKVGAERRAKREAERSAHAGSRDGYELLATGTLHVHEWNPALVAGLERCTNGRCKAVRRKLPVQA